MHPEGKEPWGTRLAVRLESVGLFPHPARHAVLSRGHLPRSAIQTRRLRAVGLLAVSTGAACHPTEGKLPGWAVHANRLIIVRFFSSGTRSADKTHGEIPRGAWDTDRPVGFRFFAVSARDAPLAGRNLVCAAGITGGLVGTGLSAKATRGTHGSCGEFPRGAAYASGLIIVRFLSIPAG